MKLTIVFGCFLCVIAMGDFAFADLFWLNSHEGKLQRGSDDGSGPIVDLRVGLQGPEQLAIDELNEKLYWTERLSGEIWRSNLDGTNAAAFVTGLDDPFGVAVDSKNGKLFWTDQDANTVVSADLDTGLNSTIIASNQARLTSLVLDATNERVFWAQGTGEFKLNSADYDGSNQELLLSDFGPRQLSIDVRNGKLYMTEHGSNDIFSVNTDGSSLELFADNELMAAASAVAIDENNGKVFWSSNFEDGRFYSKNTDGSGQMTVYSDINAVSMVHSNITAVPEPSSIALTGVLTSAFFFYRRRRKAIK